MERITSVKNERVKTTAKLLSSGKARKDAGLFVLEGLRLCMDIVRSGLQARELYVSEDFSEKHPEEWAALRAVSDQVFLVSDAVLERLSDTKTPQGVCALVPIPKKDDTLWQDSKGKLILLENIQDPANLGAIARTAEALGISGLLVSGGCDVYSPKALRASMGALLRLPVEETEAEAALARAKAAGVVTFASTPDTAATPITDVDFSGPALLVVGNEANGVSKETQAACDKRVTIPMAGRAESLNAAAAAAICMWEMVR